MMLRHWSVAAALASTALVLSGPGCSSSENGSTSSKPAGTEGGPCRADDTCDPGLQCLSDLCVDSPGAGGTGGSGGAGSGGSSGSSSGSGGSGGAGASGTGGDGGGQAGAGGNGPGGDAMAGAGGDAGSSSGGTGGDGGTAGADAGTDCNGVHPNVSGGERFCDPGACRCVDDDLCYSRATVARCCTGRVVCRPQDGGMCEGSHPLLDASVRFCGPGDCYCAPSDACYSASSAAGCCPSDVMCY